MEIAKRGEGPAEVPPSRREGDGGGERRVFEAQGLHSSAVFFSKKVRANDIISPFLYLNMTNLSWNTPEYRHTKKTVEWFLASGIIAVALIATSVLLGNILFAVVIAVAAFVFLLHAQRAPRIVRASVSERGIEFGDAFYEYVDLASFWVEARDGDARLILKHKKLLSLLTVIHLESVNPNIIRAALLEFLTEEELHEPLSQKIMEYLGF